MPNKKEEKKKIYKGELGGTGTTVYKGVVSDVEYNSQLDTEYGGQGLRTYNYMRKSDPIIRSALLLVKLGILQADWTIEGEDEEQNKFLKEALFERMDKSWPETVRDILTYLDFGFYVAEKVYKLEDGKVWIDKFAFRDQKSIVKFEMQNGKPGIQQQLQGDEAEKRGLKGAGLIDIPREKILIFTNEKEGENWRGQSMLRTCYKPWFFKENYEKIDAIGFERGSVGVPVFTMPLNPDADDSARADELGENLRANEKAYVKLPNGWLFDIIYPSGNRMAGEEAIRRFNRDIYSNFLAHFLDLGSGNSGSRALGSTQSDAFYRSLSAIGDYVCSIVNKYAVAPLIDYNFAGAKAHSIIKVTGIEQIDFEMFTSALSAIVNSKVILPDDELEDFVRMTLKLPKKTTPRVVEDPNANPNDPFNKDKTKIDPKNKDKTKQKPEAKKKLSEAFGWRELTLAEQKVNFRGLERQMNLFEDEFKREVTAVLMPEIKGLIEQSRIALQTRDIKRVQDLQTRFNDELRQQVLKKYQQAYETGKITASNELRVPAPKNSTEVINVLTTQSSIISEKMMIDLLNEAKLSVLAQIQQLTPTDEAMAALESILTDRLINQTGYAASAIVVGGINSGRNDLFGENEEKVYAIQRSEILDDRVCNYCLSMDGRVFTKDDSFSKKGQYHFLCRGINVAISELENDKPEVTGIPGELRARVGTLTEFEQMRKPMPLQGSLAAEFINNK